MSIPSSKQINQTLYTAGTLNPKKNKKQNKKNKISNLKLQNNDSQIRCASNAVNLKNRTKKIEENQKNDRSYSRQTESTSYRNSPDYQRNENQKNNYKINPTNKLNGIKNEIVKNQKININQLPPQNQKKRPLNVGFVQNQQQNQDNINSRCELAIQGMNLPCAPKILPLGVLVNSVSTIDRQRQKYQEELKLIQKKLSLARTPLTFTINKKSFLFKKLDFKMAQPYRYSKEQVVNPKKQTLWNRNSKKSQLNCQVYSLNVDTYLEKRDKKKEGKYPKVNEQQRIQLGIHQIKRLMEDGADFICLQQVNSSKFRKSLLNLLRSFNSNSDDQYLYPKNLQSQEQLITTMILSKHQVEFGQLQFLIQNPQSEQQTKKLSKQAFCTFNVKIGEIQETVCILSSHLKSNERNNMENAQKIRKQQIDCIQHFGLKFKRFFCIGDMNIGNSDKFKSENAYVQMKFHDAINYGQSQRRGSFLFMNQRGKILDERFDRVWIDKKSALKTQVQVQYIDILLPSFKGLGLSREQLLVRNNGIFEYRTISDHSLMRASIIFTQ